MPASPTEGQGLTQKALIEVLRNQHRNKVQTAELDCWTRSPNSELTEPVSGLVPWQSWHSGSGSQRDVTQALLTHCMKEGVALLGSTLPLQVVHVQGLQQVVAGVVVAAIVSSS